MDYFRADKNLIEQNSLQLEEKNKTIEEYLAAQRDDIQKRIFPLLKTLSTSNIHEIIQLQSDTLTMRQEMSDEINKYLSKMSKENTKLKKISADRMEYYITGCGVKYSATERVQLMGRDIRELQRSVELLQFHIDFLRECRISCDQIGYSVKNRIALLQYV